VELRFARAAPISQDDPRVASVLLRRVAVESVSRTAPSIIQFPADLKRPALAYSGVYEDGWAQNDIRVLLAGGPPTTLTVAGQTIVKGQRVTAFVDGRRLGGAKMPAGDDIVRVHLASSKGPRLLELRFARTAPIAANDPRPAATLLRKISLGRTSRSAPVSGRSDLTARLSASAEVPAVQASGSGTFTAAVSQGRLRWHLRVHGLSSPIVAAVIRVGRPGQVGPRLVYLCGQCADSADGTLRLTSAQEKAIRAGGTYVNVGTSEFPNGAIRGQLASG
jgi:hypothetical protein